MMSLRCCAVSQWLHSRSLFWGWINLSFTTNTNTHRRSYQISSSRQFDLIHKLVWKANISKLPTSLRLYHWRYGLCVLYLLKTVPDKLYNRCLLHPACHDKNISHVSPAAQNKHGSTHQQTLRLLLTHVLTHFWELQYQTLQNTYRTCQYLQKRENWNKTQYRSNTLGLRCVTHCPGESEEIWIIVRKNSCGRIKHIC